ncbi:hypothetical protein, partial [Bacteroides sp. 519]|uniref:hypothetical protein n=1 Tax=Bacteroides sp. 519 TaxID=2302937 RepID=UPI0013D6C2C4
YMSDDYAKAGIRSDVSGKISESELTLDFILDERRVGESKSRTGLGLTAGCSEKNVKNAITHPATPAARKSSRKRIIL